MKRSFNPSHHHYRLYRFHHHFALQSSSSAMVNLGIFHGTRLEFLLGEMAGYTAAAANGTKDEFIKNVLRRYFKRFPPDLPSDQDPSEEELAAVDDTLPDVEYEVPDPQDWPEDQAGYTKALEIYEKRQADIILRSAVSLPSLSFLPIFGPPSSSIL